MKLTHLTTGQRVFLGFSAFIVVSALAFSLMCFRMATRHEHEVAAKGPRIQATAERVEYAANVESLPTQH